MRQKTPRKKSDRSDKRIREQETTGPNGIAVMPPAYGINAVDCRVQNRLAIIQREPHNTERQPHGPLSYLLKQIPNQKIQHLVRALYTSKYNSNDYKNAIKDWPNYWPIWTVLRTRETKENFVKYLFLKHDPNKFARSCQAYADRISVKYSRHYKKLTDKRIRMLPLKRFIVVPSKFGNLPMCQVIVYGHAFNAVLVGHNHADLGSYIFVDMTKYGTRKVFTAANKQQLDRAIGPVGLLELVVGPTSWRFQRFFQGPRGSLTKKKISKRLQIDYVQVASALFLADDYNSWATNVANGLLRRNFRFLKYGAKESFYGQRIWRTLVRRWTATYFRYLGKKLDKHLTTDSLALVREFCYGKLIRLVPEGKTYKLDEARLINLINKAYGQL